MIAVARTQGALEELDDEIRAAAPGASATLVPLDLADFDALDRLGRSIYRPLGPARRPARQRRDAGAALAPAHISPKAFDEVFALNVTANWRLIRSLDPLLRASPAGRAAFLTSGAASRANTRAYWGLYAASKAALDLLARTYAAETATTRDQGDAGQSRPHAHPHARRGHAGRGPDDAADARGTGAEDRASSVAATGRETGKLYDFPTDKVLGFRDPE